MRYKKRKFSDDDISLVRLAYPSFSNQEIAEVIGCSITWIEKLAKREGLKKGSYCFLPGQCGFPLDLAGWPFGKLVVLSKDQRKSKNNTVWRCRCTCGKEFGCRAALLRKGKITSCQDCARTKKEKRIKRGCDGASTWSKIKAHAHERGISVEVDLHYVLKLLEEQGSKCALSGLPLSLTRIIRGRRQGNASLDRIDSSKGYIHGNVQWLHKDVNQMKNKHSESYFIELCTRITENNKGKVNDSK